ncbi:MAG: PEGA domain-containing protein [Dictyoglomus sp.]|nr:PEGA domain-containing protein [Dictyoglomus sp.]MCX7942705.1 PEGA domain-containing protein [Dictyoglomaceae bacterium]MDW8187962.1 PEGA domain-containing protein [Dictyoglomus sp.]
MKRLIFTLIILTFLTSFSFSQQISIQERPASPSWEKIIIVPNPETKLQLDLWLNKPEGSVYRIGEELKIFVRANDDVYLYIFDLTPDGDFKLIFPNMYSGNNFIRKDQTYTFPDKPVYSFKVSPPVGKEFIIGIISKKPLNLFPGRKLESLKPFESLEKNIEKALKNIEKVLIEEKKETWAQKVTYFYVQEVITQGRVKINSNPSRAQVYINNDYKGNTPLTLTLSEGSYRVLVRLEGYRDYETNIIVEGNREKEYTFNLSPRYGDLTILSTPSGASIYLDGVYRGRTPLTLKNLLVKTYELKLTYPGYQDKIERVEVKEGTEIRINLSLLPTFGSLSIYSNPSGAEVYLNGVHRGITPLTISNLSPGTYQIQLRKSGYKDLLSSVVVTSGTTSSYNFNLTPLLGMINVFSNPSGAEVYIDRVYRGKTPLSLSDVPSGTYDIRVVLSGYEEYFERISLSPGETKQITANLKPLYGEVLIDSKPQGAKVYINGKYQGNTPINLNLFEGKYNLTLSLSGYYEVNTELNVKSKEKSSYVFVLSPIEVPYIYSLSFTKGIAEGNLIITRLENSIFSKEDGVFNLTVLPSGILETKVPLSRFKKIFLRVNFSISSDSKGIINPIFEITLNGRSITLPFAVESREYITVKWDITSYWLQDKENTLSFYVSKGVEGSLKIKEIFIEGK